MIDEIFKLEKEGDTTTSLNFDHSIGLHRATRGEVETQDALESKFWSR